MTTNEPSLRHSLHTASRGMVAGLLIAAIMVPAGAGAQDAKGRPTINVANVILAEPAIETPFPIQVGPLEALPRNSFLRIRGLPAAANLSEGHPITAGSWAVPLSALATLKIVAPVAASGKTELAISVMAIDGAVLAETRATLLVAAASLIAPPAAPPSPPSTSVASLGAAPAQPAPPAPRIFARPAAEPEAGKLAPADRERASKLTQRGDEQMIGGDVASARLFYQRAAEIGHAQGAMALAATYDPDELARWNVRGIQPDPEQAKRWYERARDLGASDAGERLRRLGAR